MITSSVLALSVLSNQHHGFDAGRLARIPERMKAYIEARDVAGTVTLIQRHGKVIQQDAQGLARMNPNQPMRADTIFQVMSMTKPITAIAVMICAEKGLLNLDDRVDRYLPKLANMEVFQADGTRKRQSRSMTIRHLLTHTSGLSSNDPGGLDDDMKAKLTLSEYTSRFGSDPLNSEPGERIAYAGPGMSAAGRIVEIVSGKRFEQFLQEEVFGPLRMTDTYFFAPERDHPRIAWMYTSENGTLTSFQENPYKLRARFANPAGGLYSTASDMAAVLQCLLDGGKIGGHRLLSPKSIEVLTTSQVGSLLADGSDAQGYALGFSVIRSANGTATLRSIGSFGHTGAFGTEYWADPKTGVIAVFMSQSFSDRVRKTFNTMVNAAFVGP